MLPAATAAAALAPFPFRPVAFVGVSAARAAAAQKKGAAVSCLVALAAEVPSSSPSNDGKGSDLDSMVGSRIRIKAPLKVYHVPKAPELDLCGFEGVIKQHIGIWKGKRISANLPFKVEFSLQIEGQPSPVRFFAHLKEEEFEFL